MPLPQNDLFIILDRLPVFKGSVWYIAYVVVDDQYCLSGKKKTRKKRMRKMFSLDLGDPPLIPRVILQCSENILIANVICLICP